MPGVINVSGAIEGWDTTTPFLSAIILKDLESVGSIELLRREDYRQALKLVDFPSLTSIRNLSIDAKLPVNVSLPSLETASQIYFNGNFSGYKVLLNVPPHITNLKTGVIVAIHL